MEYPEKLYVFDKNQVKQRDPEDWDDDEDSRWRFMAYSKPELHAETNGEQTVAVYQYVGKIKLINKTVIAEPDTP
jgi:hypothetical protein